MARGRVSEIIPEERRHFPDGFERSLAHSTLRGRNCRLVPGKFWWQVRQKSNRHIDLPVFFRRVGISSPS